jgi:hypothetical protein
MRPCACVVAALLSALAGSAGAATRAVDLVVRNGTVVTMDPGRRVIEGGAVAIDAGAIVAVGPAAEIATAASSSPASSTPTPTRRWCCSAASPTT